MLGLTASLPSLLKLPQEINIQNMNVELVAQMFKNYRSNVLFHLEGKTARHSTGCLVSSIDLSRFTATESFQDPL